MVFQTHEYNLKSDLGLEVEIITEHKEEASLDDRLTEWAAQIPTNV